MSDFELTVLFYNKHDKLSFTKDEIHKILIGEEKPSNFNKDEWDIYLEKDRLCLSGYDLGVIPLYSPPCFHFNGNFGELHEELLKELDAQRYVVTVYYSSILTTWNEFNYDYAEIDCKRLY